VTRLTSSLTVPNANLWLFLEKGNQYYHIEPTAAAASKEKILLISIHEIHWTNLSYYGNILADYYSCYSLSRLKETSVCIAAILTAISAGTHLISPSHILVPHKDGKILYITLGLISQTYIYPQHNTWHTRFILVPTITHGTWDILVPSITRGTNLKSNWCWNMPYSCTSAILSDRYVLIFSADWCEDPWQNSSLWIS